MADDAAPFSLKRWSQRKLETRRQSAPTVAVPAALPPHQERVTGGRVAAESATPAAAVESAAPELPPIESLSLESDFSVFLRPDVDAGVRQQALRKLFSDPHFNVMDGLDVYIDDYSLPDPISPDIVRDLVQSRFIIDPPKTRINAEGYVEDIPPEELTQVEADAGAAPAAEEGAAGQAPKLAQASPEGANCTPLGDSERSEARGYMTVADHNLHLCSCNGTMPLDATALGKALDLPAAPAIKTVLCQKELAQFADNAAGDVIVACTQEARLLGNAAEERGKTQAIRFVDIRGTGGWSAEAKAATPKIAALLAMAALPEPAPVPSVSYKSQGQLLIVGPAEAALHWGKVLSQSVAVTVLMTGRTHAARLPLERSFPIYSGKLTRLEGWLGAFDAAWTQENPIDLDACTRCNACVRACPEHAIDWSYQVDLDRCRSHRACVAACGVAGAIDFDRAKHHGALRSEQFDLVLDLDGVPHFRMHQPPQGYFAPGADPIAQAQAAAELATMVGEFEKPKYFNYKASICAHSRSKKTGCTQCIDVCSTSAIRADGDHVLVEPHLCMGCGACATTCPSGALSYVYPSVPDVVQRLKTLLATYGKAGGRDACILLHAEDGRDVVSDLARRWRGLPARVIPFEVHHVAAIGIDVWLTAIALGACQVAVLATGSEAPQYRELLSRQMHIGEVVLQAFGYQGAHLRIFDTGDLDELDAAIWSWPAALGVRVAATFAPTADKRTTTRLAIEHLARHAPLPQREIALPPGAPFGTVNINRDACTMCLACVGSCPEGALLDAQELPQLRFIETKCVQCGLCETTCPEHAITLAPRLNLAPEAKEPRVLNEAAIFRCIACNKAMGTEKLVGAMLSKLAGHSMFAAPGALDRLRMCADCRVIDMMKHEQPIEPPRA